MLPINNYKTLTNDQLREELVDVVNELVFNIGQHASLSADYHVEYARSWAQSAGGSASAKAGDAEFQHKDTMSEIIDRKAMVEMCTARRDLILCLIK